MIAYLTNPENIYSLLIRIYCIGSINNSLEFFYLFEHFSGNGIFSWKVLRFNVKSPFNVINFDRLFSQKGVFALLFLRLSASLVLLLCPVNNYTILLIIAIGVVTSAFKIRNSVGNDGSDQMRAIVTIALIIGFATASASIAQLSLYVICAHTIISYVGAGLPKLMSEKWRNGTAVAQIMNTKTYGNPYIAQYFNTCPRWINYFVNWSVILFESLFFMVLIIPSPYCYLFIVVGVLFHLYNAVVMGLNNFFWSFVMTYPAIIYTHIVIWGS